MQFHTYKLIMVIAEEFHKSVKSACSQLVIVNISQLFDKMMVSYLYAFISVYAFRIIFSCVIICSSCHKNGIFLCCMYMQIFKQYDSKSFMLTTMKICQLYCKLQCACVHIRRKYYSSNNNRT